MQKTRNNLLNAAVWLTAAFIGLRIIYRLLYSVERIKGAAGSSNLQSVTNEIIIGCFVYVLPAILVAIGLFIMKRGLVIGGLTIQTGISLLQLVLKFVEWMFPHSGSYEQILAYKRDFLNSIDDALWALAVLLLVYGLFRMIRQEHPQMLGDGASDADASAAASSGSMQGKPNVLFLCAACSMALYMIYCIVCIVIIIRQSDSQALWERFSSFQLTTGIIIPVVSGILLTVGLFLNKPVSIALGLAAKAVSSALFFLKHLIFLFRGDKGYFGSALSNLSFLVWNLAFILLVIGLFKMIRSQNTQITYPTDTQPAVPTSDPAGAAPCEESPADD